MQINEEKKKLRAFFKHKRETMLRKEEKDSRIYNNFKLSGIYNGLSEAFVYVSSEIEADTKMLINQMLLDKIKVAVPLCNKENCTMKFYYIESLSELQTGHYGILEPKGEKEKLAVPTEKTVCIVPALSFDGFGYRLGFGKGYYDRFLSDFKGTSVGLCYEECLSEKLPYDEYDKTVRFLVTEKNIYEFNGK